MGERRGEGEKNTDRREGREWKKRASANAAGGDCFLVARRLTPPILLLATRVIPLPPSLFPLPRLDRVVDNISQLCLSIIQYTFRRKTRSFLSRLLRRFLSISKFF